MSTDITERAAPCEAASETAGCEAVIEFLGVLLGPCGMPSAGLYRRICVHEHVRDAQLCREHVEHPVAGLCRTCHDLGGGLSHDCPVSIALVTA